MGVGLVARPFRLRRARRDQRQDDAGGVTAGLDLLVQWQPGVRRSLSNSDLVALGDQPRMQGGGAVDVADA